METALMQTFLPHSKNLSWKYDFWNYQRKLWTRNVFVRCYRQQICFPQTTLYSMNWKAPENCLFSRSNDIISDISVESRAWNPFYFRLAFQLTDFNALNYAQTMPSFHVLRREKRNLFDLFMVLKLKKYTHIRLWRLSSFQTEHIVQTTRDILQIETYFHKYGKRKMFSHVVGKKSEDEMLYLCDDDE